MTDPRIELRLDGPVAVVTIRRPEKLNALDAAMVDAFIPLCRRIERSAARVVILTGEGGASFCAGGDIAAWSGLGADAFARHWLREGHQAFDALARLIQPVVAVLNGHCLGGGLELAACADYRIAEQHVTLGLPETGLGIVPGWSGTQRLSRRFGPQVVRRMALWGEVYPAQAALDLGIVDQIAPQGQGMAAGLALAQRVLTRSAKATELTKMLINAAEGEEGGRIGEVLAGAIAATSSELAEGLSAFREKRKPRFDEDAG